jgi:hypothetical protein
MRRSKASRSIAASPLDGVAAVVAQLEDIGQPFPPRRPSGEDSLLYSARLAEGMHGHRTRRQGGNDVGSEQAKGVTPGEADREILRGVPLKRPGTADEVANLVVLLASELSTYITGTRIAIDGGMTRTI